MGTWRAVTGMKTNVQVTVHNSLIRFAAFGIAFFKRCDSSQAPPPPFIFPKEVWHFTNALLVYLIMAFMRLINDKEFLSIFFILSLKLANQILLLQDKTLKMKLTPTTKSFTPHPPVSPHFL